MTRRLRLIQVLLLLTCCIGLSACATVGPEYRRPDLKMPVAWSAPSEKGSVTELATWWSTFKDPALDTLLDAAQKDNPTLSKASAAITKARASRDLINAGFLPQASATATTGASGSLKNGSGTTTSAAAALDASWELDIVGKNLRASESASDLVQARSADLHDARITLAAEVATDYVDYRACRLKEGYYEEQADSQAKTAKLTALSANAGFTAPADARLAEASASSTRSTALAQKTECAVLVKSLVALTGMVDDSVWQLLGTGVHALPKPEEFTVISVPAELLRQRPDVVSAEKSLASASAQIGVAEAGRYPSLTLSGSVSLSAASGTALTAPWSFGPTLSLPVFTGGKTKAQILSAQADYDSALANYRQTVRTAVREVEQALTRLDSMTRREEQARISADGYGAFLSATEQNWRVGRSSLLDLETARRSAITAEIALLELQQNRLQYWIALYKAVGGGWKEQGGAQ
jgi:outer membrane protein, multidrug efflux system